MDKNNKMFRKIIFWILYMCIFIIVRAAASHVVTMDNTEALLDPGASSRPLPVVSPSKDPRASAYKDYEPDAYKNRNKKINIPVLDNCLISNESLQLSQR